MKKNSIFIALVFMLILSSCTYIEDYVPGQATPTLPGSSALKTQVPTVTLPPSATPEPSLTPTPTATRPPTFTPTPTVPPKPFALQPGAMIPLPAFSHASAGCTWMGVAGQVIGEDGQPVTNLVVTVIGTQNGAPAEWMGYTGSATVYGAGGFEIQLAGQAAAAKYTIQLFDLNGNPLSEVFPFTTSADCQQNLMMINFSPNLNLKPAVWLPLVEH
ncbi:hypothetical protein [Longilinea arvoryzae]|nr:hypothetical protein [Longilinea arvoryzae]